MAHQNSSFDNPLKQNSFWGNIFGGPKQSINQLSSVLRKMPLFTEMNDDELAEFIKIMHARSFKSNEPIFWEGEPGIGMYVIKTGVVSVCRISAEHGREELAVLHPGDFFGEMALIDEGPRPATCIVKEHAEIAGLFRPDLLALIERKPRLGNKFLFRIAALLGKRLFRLNKENQSLREKMEAANIIF